ncbi:motility protein A [Abyssisolibacter fermentans]|uniref:motility protein A n=1 Tax=Abyssisolibacter fermentans TaxID=1766203 RepID=UPI00082BCF73|nr:MotA/TolQ/ExbB proton channel family protein [Abyssisolibacter fermentans]
MKKYNTNKYSVIIVILLLIALTHSIFGSVSAKSFLNLQALEIIVAGVLLTIIISFSFDTLLFTVKMLKASFQDNIDYEGAIYTIYNYAIKVKKNGVLKIQHQIKHEEAFIKKSMILVCDYVKPVDMEDILSKEIEAAENDLYRAYNVLKLVAQVAPAFGLIGTLIGMIGLLSHLNDASLLAYNMSSALVSTLYGALLANFVAVPLMGRLKELIYKRILYYKIIAAGCILIAKNDSTRNVFDKMNAMLPDDKKLQYPKQRLQERKTAYEPK